MGSPSSFRARFGGKRVIWQAYYASYCLGMTDFVPVHLVLALDEGLDTGAITEHAGIQFRSLEGASGVRERFVEGAIDELAPAAIAALPAEPDGWIALSATPGEALPRLCRSRGIPCHALAWERYFWFGCKSTLQLALTELNLPRLAGRWVELSGAGYSELAAEFGGRFVMQLDSGADGSGTAVVSDAIGFARAAIRFHGGLVWVAPYAGGLSLNVNALATPAGTVVAYPSVQLTGHGVLRSREAGHCGNDFTATAALPGDLRASVREQTARIGDWMAGHGYRGIFGLDFVVDERTAQAYIVDLNPRWQGSTSLQSQASQRKGLIPLAAMEAAFLAGVLNATEILAHSDSQGELGGGPHFLMPPPPPGPWRAGRAIPPGVYSEDLAPLRPALELWEITANEILINGHNPRRGALIEAGARLVRLCTLRAMVDPSTGRLAPWVSGVAQRIDGALGLEAGNEV